MEHPAEYSPKQEEITAPAVLEFKAQILKAGFLPLNVDSTKCHLGDVISPSLDLLVGKMRKQSIRTAVVALPCVG